MNDRDLKYYCTLVETGNYTQTAKVYQLTQPAITAAVKRLEAEFGVQLLFQSNHRSQLTTTPAGRVLYIHGRRLLNSIDEIHSEVVHANDDKIRIGFSNIAGGIWLSKVLLKFMQNGLMNMLEMREAHSEILLNDLANGKIDAAIFSDLQPTVRKDLRTILLGKRQMCVIISSHNPLRRLNTINPHQLKNIPIIARPQIALTRKGLEMFCHQGNYKPSILFETDSNSLLQELVSQDMGIGFLIDGSILSNNNLLKIPLSTSDTINVYMQLAVRKTFLPNARQKRCIEVLQSVSTRGNV